MRNSDPELSQGPGRWIRLVVVLVIGLLLVGPFVLATAWVSFAGGRFGWVLTAATFGAFGFLVGWLAVSKHWHRARVRTTATLAVLGVIAGIVVAHFAPPTPGRLRDAIKDVARADWTLVEDHESGNAACFDYCTSVARQYKAPGDLQAVSTDVEAAIEDWQCPPPDVGVRVRWECRHGDDIEVSVELAEGSGFTTVYVTATSG